MGRVIIVQQIESEWSKAARGGARAVRRNAVSEAAKVPLHQIQTSGLIFLHHKLCYFERDNFQTPHEEITTNPTVRPLAVGCVTVDDCVTINEYADGVSAKFAYTERCGGAPTRRGMQKTLTFALNEWGQIVYNGRFSNWEDSWRYEKMTVNIGVFDPLSNSVFTRRPPTARYSAMAHLF